MNCFIFYLFKGVKFIPCKNNNKLGKGDNLWLVSWGDLIPSLFVLFIAGDCLHSSLLRIKRGEEEGGARWSTCFTFLVFSIIFMGDLFFIGNFIVNKLWS